MLTPQQIQETSFEKALFGGYDMDSVDDFLEPLTEDYITLYKENSVLKSKMRILVEKLEEYRRQETSMQNAILAAQKTSEQMVADAERRCAKMLREAEENAAEKAKNVGALADEEKARLELAQQETAKFIDGIERRIKRQLELLEELRSKELPPVQSAEATRAYGIPAPEEEPQRAYDFDKEPIAPSTQEKADALIEEIGQSIEASLGGETLGDLAREQSRQTGRVPEITMHGELPPEKKKIFDDLKFGRNYDPKENK